MMKRLLVATAFAIAASSVGAIEISEAMLNDYVNRLLNFPPTPPAIRR